MATYTKRVQEIFHDLVDQKEPVSTTSGENEEKSSKPISCNPHDKELFLERVKTFTATNWAAKSVELSPLHCAQYGWQNEFTDQLRCVTCDATLYAGLPDDWDSNAYSEICSKIQHELQIGHDHLCPWPANPCPPSFLSLPAYTAEQWKAETKKHFSSLVKLGANLPDLDEDGIARMRLLNNSCIEELLSKVFKHSTDNDDDALYGKVAAILAVTGWKVSEPVVEDPSINCSMCGKEAGLWNFKSMTSRSSKKVRISFVSATASQTSLDVPDNMSSNVSIKSENSNVSENMTSELAKLATSSDSLAQSDLMKPAGSQESLVNLRVSDQRHMAVDDDNDLSVQGMSTMFQEPKAPPQATPHGLMKELLLSTAPGSTKTLSKYSDSIFSEVGSECFEKRLEGITEDEIVLEKAITENPHSQQPAHTQQQWMKELLLLTAPSSSSAATYTDASESVFSEVGSVSFDKRLEVSSMVNSPRAATPVRSNSIDEEEVVMPTKTKRMKLQGGDSCLFNVIDEHRHWCPWAGNTLAVPSNARLLSSPGTPLSPTGSLLVSPSKSAMSLQKIPGWKLVLVMLLPSLLDVPGIAQSPPDEAWRSVRTVLRDCVSYSSSSKSHTTPEKTS